MPTQSDYLNVSVELGRTKYVKEIFESSGSHGFSISAMIHRSVELGHYELVLYLLSVKRLNNREVLKPLLLACKSGEVKCARYLFAYLDPKYTPDGVFQDIMLACRKHAKIFNYILNNKRFKPNIRRLRGDLQVFVR